MNSQLLILLNEISESTSQTKSGGGFQVSVAVDGLTADLVKSLYLKAI